MHSIGRTDKCPCNSGRKYKDCHRRSFKPLDKFEVLASSGNVAPDWHLERNIGSEKWIKNQGRLAFRIGYQEKTYPEVDSAIHELGKIPEQRNILRERVIRLRHKLYERTSSVLSTNLFTKKGMNP